MHTNQPEERSHPDVFARHLDWKGFLCNALNPKAPIYFLSLFTIVLSPELPLSILAVYGVWIMLLQLFWFSLITLFFSQPIIRSRFLAMSHSKVLLGKTE